MKRGAKRESTLSTMSCARIWPVFFYRNKGYHRDSLLDGIAKQSGYTTAWLEISKTAFAVLQDIIEDISRVSVYIAT
jgi:predicted NAD/FAD-binding protein